MENRALKKAANNKTQIKEMQKKAKRPSSLSFSLSNACLPNGSRSAKDNNDDLMGIINNFMA